MSNYWKKKLEELEAEEEKKKQSSSTSGSSSDYWKNKMDELEESNSKKEDIAPVKDTTEDEKKWYQKIFKGSSAFDDGYDFGDAYKSAVATGKDFTHNIYEGLTGIVEGTIDAGAGLAGTVGGWFGADKFQDKMNKFVAKDIINEDKVADVLTTINGGFLSDIWMGKDNYKDLSVSGDTLDQWTKSGGQLVGQLALGAAGVPWYVTSGVTSFGGEYENALNQGATGNEAFFSGLISAGSEILSEKLIGGSGLGEKGVLDSLANGITNKALKRFVNFGMDVTGEGVEEAFSQFMGNLGSALYREENLGEILASEEAFDSYLEAFAGGAVLGGAANVGKFGSSIKNKTDYRTGLNDSEQAVFDKVYNDRLAEAEESGKKLTNKEKSKIYDEVMEDIDNGRIDIDTIEEALGGDDYKAYQDTVNNDDALQKEFDELGNLKKSDFTAKQDDRYNELKQLLADETRKTNRETLKTKLSDNVFNLAKSTRLAESYNEDARRGQAFQADLSQYDAKQQETIKKAVESGILNNSRRTHAFVDMVAKITADKGVLFDFTNNTKLKESGFAIDGKSVNGYVTKDGVTLNIDSHKSLNSVVGHEIAHVLEGTELYTELQNAVFDYAKSKNDYQGRYDTLTELYKNVKGANVDAELTADLVGDYLFTDADFVNNLSAKNRNVFQKIYDEVKYLWKVATAGSKEKRQLEQVKRAFDKAYKASGKAVEGTKYSLADSDGKTLTKEQSEYFKDSKMRDENGNLKVMYHGSQDAGFHVFDAKMSDDDISFFFVDRNDVAASYSGTTETYEAQTIHTAEDMNNFIESIGAEGYEVVEKDGKFTLLYEGDRVADSNTAKGIYEEFCWYEGVGEGDANYKVYLNLKNPLEIDAKGRPWNKIDAEFSQEIYDKYNSLTAEEKAALVDLAEWEDFRLFNSEIQEATDGALASAYAKMGEGCNIYDLFSVAADSFSEESMRENARGYLKTRDYAQRAKAQGHDGVIFKNLVDNGGYSNGSEGASTVAIAFDSNQIKSVANAKPTGDPDIRYSLTEYTAEEKKEHNKKVLEHFGRTYKWAETGYLLLDGTKLDLSGKHDGAPGGYRTVDHRDITEALGYDYGGGGYSDSLVQFMSEGNIRIVPEVDGFNLSVKPTKAQEQALSEYISQRRGEVVVDIDDLNGNTVVSVEYPRGTYYTKILNDIREWFDNGKKPEVSGLSSFRSLTKKGVTPKKYGNYNVYGNEIGLKGVQNAPETVQEDVAPVQEDIAENATTTPATVSKMEQVEETAPMPETIDSLPSEPTVYDLQQRKAELETEMKAAKEANEQEKGVKLYEEYRELLKQIDEAEAAENAMQNERFESLSDADVPPEMEAPYYGESEEIAPEDPFENRDIKAVGNRKVKAYMYENPEVKPFFQAEANVMLGELQDTQKGERFYTSVEGGVPGEYGAESLGVWTGVSRNTTADIEYLLDTVKMSYADIEKGLKAIIKDHGAENYAAAKKIEFILHDRLMNGHTDITGLDIPADQNYINLMTEKAIQEYTEEARQRVFADSDAPPVADIAPVPEVAEENTAPAQEAPIKETYEAIRPKKETNQEPRMKRVKEGGTEHEENRRRFAESATGSDAVDGKVKIDELDQELIHYQPISNKKTLESANASINQNGYDNSVTAFRVNFKNAKHKMTVDDIVVGERLIQEAAKRGDLETAKELIQDIAILGTELGQKVQALSIIKRLTPEGQLGVLTKTVERGKLKGDKAFEGVELTDEMVDHILKAWKNGTFDQNDLNRRVEDVKQQIADQMKVTARDKINAWRYLSMLGNPKTHNRNIISNVANFLVRIEKNAIARSVEDATLRNQKPELNKTAPVKTTEAPVSDIIPNGTKVKASDRDNIGTIRSYDANTGKYTVYFENKKGQHATVKLDANVVKPINTQTQKAGKTGGNAQDDIAPVRYRTKTWERSTDAVKKYADKVTAEEMETWHSRGKYSTESDIKSRRKIFKNKALQWAAEKNTAALEWEDRLFSKATYKYAFREFLTANGVKTDADIQNNPELIKAAKDYAMEEAKRSTFQQDSDIADKIAAIENSNPVYGAAVGSVLPFKKTPINVAKTAVAYSPLGFVRGVYDYVQVKKGNKAATEAIDHLAQSITGTSLTLIGFALANMGVLNGAGDDDKDGKYDYQLGKQAYSINIGGDTYSINWLSPVAMPLFVGVNAYEQMVEKKEWDANVVMEALGQTLDPLSEMSFLSSLNNVLSSYDNGMQKFFGIGEAMVSNYASQFIPTLSSQLAATIDTKKRSTKASADSDWKAMEQTFNSLLYKIPFARNTLEPTTDIWGNEVKQTENIFARGFESFISPSIKRDGIATETDEEIKGLYAQTGNTGVVPSIPSNYTYYEGQKYNMSAEEYTAYKQTYGQTANALMERLFNTSTYRNATAADRAKMVGYVYDYARDEANRELLAGRDVEYTNAKEDGIDVYKENPIVGAIRYDMTVDEYSFMEKNTKKYEYFTDVMGLSYDDYASADEDTKRAYSWAYENPGKYTLSKAVSSDFLEYYGYKSTLSDFEADKDEDGKSISGSKKEKIIDYINNDLDNLDYGQKIILYRSMYNSQEDRDNYNRDIVDYLNSREDISYEDMATILKELGFTVTADGNIYWD